jgi:hypothetical protein
VDEHSRALMVWAETNQCPAWDMSEADRVLWFETEGDRIGDRIADMTEQLIDRTKLGTDFLANLAERERAGRQAREIVYAQEMPVASVERADG